MSQSLGNITDVFERITDAFLALDKNWNCTYINKKAGEILDRIPLQMIGKNLLSEFPEVVGTTFHKAFLECMEEQKYIHLEEFYPPYNKWFEVNFYPSPEGLTVYFRDITERKKAEEVLKENEKFLKIVIDNFPRSFLSVINKELIAIFNGGEGFSKLKLDPELFLGKTVQEVFAPYGKAILDTVIIAYEKTFSGEAQVFELFINDQFQLYKTVPLLSGQNEINSILVVVENITEKRLSENTIKESEEKYRTLVEQASDGIIISDQSLALLEANNMICKMLGYTKEELFKLSVFDITIISKSDPPTRFEELKAGKSILQERRFKRKDGSVFPVEVSSIMMRNGSYLAFARDITKRKKAEVELATAHDRLLFHLENSPLGYIEWDKNLFLKSWSKRIEEIFGWNEKEFIEKHKNGLSLVYDEDVPEISVVAQQLMSGEVVRNHMTHRNYTKKGEVIWCEWYNSVLKDKEGNVITIMSLVQDITERKRTEKELLTSEERLRIGLNTANIAVFNQDKDLRYVWMYQPQLGYNSEEVVGHTDADLLPPEASKQVTKIKKHVLESGLKEDAEVPISIGGKDFIYYLVVEPFRDENNSIIGITGASLDITERKLTEERLKKSLKEIRELSSHLQIIREEERTRIAREIHDELGQELTIMKMDVSWLNEKLKKSDKDTRQKTEGLMRLLDQTVNTVRRIASELRPGLLDDMGLAAALEWQLSEFEKRSGVKTEFKEMYPDLALPDTIKTGLFRIVQESLTNVGRYAKAKKVIVTLDYTGHQVELIIKDDGIGFEKEKIATKRTLGLLGMKERTEMMGGAYEINSTPGKGTIVTIIVPFEK